MSPNPELPRNPPLRWCVTGVAGFIGSHLLEALLRQDQFVAGLDDLSSGSRKNLEEVRGRVTPTQWERFRWVQGDIRSPGAVAEALHGADRVLHQAAVASVPQSIADPRRTHDVNVTGFLNILEAARTAGVGRVVYASSSAVYGDCHDLPAREDRVGACLSPYAVSKRMNEDYAGVYERCYGLATVGLRYFNVFGPRQDPAGAYAAVIPRWIEALHHGQPPEIHGDGTTSRDFCPVAGVVQANLLAATIPLPPAAPRVFNVGLGQETTLNQLLEALRSHVGRGSPAAAQLQPRHGPFRAGDIRHSRADVSAARQWLGFQPPADLRPGFAATVDWYLAQPATP